VRASVCVCVCGVVYVFMWGGACAFVCSMLQVN